MESSSTGIKVDLKVDFLGFGNDSVPDSGTTPAVEVHPGKVAIGDDASDPLKVEVKPTQSSTEDSCSAVTQMREAKSPSLYKTVLMAFPGTDDGSIVDSFSTFVVKGDYDESNDLIVEFQNTAPVPKSNVFTDLFNPLPLITMSERWILNDFTIFDIVLLPGRDLDYYHKNNHVLGNCVAFDLGIPIFSNLFMHCSLHTSKFFWFMTLENSHSLELS
ncbi:hypothetical protein QN277_023159 [Acacia crassicarpa]|uniref:Uncharacterized protein n=1 Tax=Acacia crassicarpa TaxID=499986 RepID=A0AAE1JKJ4_9FABA|nr:hypothetical protein QN277_023159 [Acacia crassicarpa]